MSTNENSDSFELIVKLGLHVKPSENSASGKRFASVGYAVSESQMQYVHEELPGDSGGDAAAYRKAIARAVEELNKIS
ncbi:hypothetical protein [Atlantibacter subterraneus]|uniref:hypothetical protein n=1 Tax=Atlantibacter subterraneus TaxID=255519 RepID=UPI002FDCBEBA